MEIFECLSLSRFSRQRNIRDGPRIIVSARPAAKLDVPRNHARPVGNNSNVFDIDIVGSRGRCGVAQRPIRQADGKQDPHCDAKGSTIRRFQGRRVGRYVVAHVLLATPPSSDGGRYEDDDVEKLVGVIRYCQQDANLSARIVAKLSTLSGLCSMCQLVSSPVRVLCVSGQTIKILDRLTRFAHQKNIVVTRFDWEQELEQERQQRALDRQRRKLGLPPVL